MPAAIAPQLPRCEYLVDPLAIETTQPRLSWECAGEGRDLSQRAYQVQVGVDRDFRQLLWDSGETKGDAMMARYAGPALSSFQRAWWRVRLWDQDGKISDWSAPATWAAGILEQKSWSSAQWLESPKGFFNHLAPRLRRRFQVDGEVVDARLYATAKGLYTAALNGESVSDDQFAPGWTDYNIRLYYRCHDVTKLLRKGENVLGATIAAGWYSGRIGWNSQGNMYGNRQQLLMLLRIEYADGRVTFVTTDQDWLVTHGPIQSTSIQLGEHVDATCDDPDWCRPQGKDVDWHPVRTHALAAKPLLQPYPTEPVRRTELVAPVKIETRKPGVHLVDFGQNLAGRVRLNLNVPGGTVVRIRHAEILDPQGDIYVDNLRQAISVDSYVARGGGREIFEPTFTFHGFRYAEIAGLTAAPQAEDVRAVVIGSDTRRVGDITTSNELVNQIYKNTVWTQRANFLEIPTDCPQRDERLGWAGDAQAFIRTATYSMDVAAFFTKWLLDYSDAQHADGAFTNVAPQPDKLMDGVWGKADAAWADCGTICPMTFWRVYGDRDLLARQYPSMLRFAEYLYKESWHHVRREEWRRFGVYGDWLSVTAHTSHDIIMTAFFAHSTRLVAEAAEILGKSEDARMLRDRLGKIIDAFRRAFVREDGAVLNGIDQNEISQTAQILALHFDLVDEKMRERVFAKLVENLAARGNKLSTGFVGLPYLLPVLSRHGRSDLCIQLLKNEEYPGWGYSIRNGATTIWERWNGWTKENGPGDPEMNSYSHYAYGSCCEWLFTDLAGIDLIEPGFAAIRVRPRIGNGIDGAKAQYHSIRGMIRSEWELNVGRVALNVTIPPNARAEIWVPSTDPTTLKEGATAVKNAEQRGGYAVVRVGSGNYRFTGAYAEGRKAAKG